MSNLAALRALTLEMWAHTPGAPRTAAHASQTHSLSQVRAAPVTRIAPAEQVARMRVVQDSIVHDLLSSPVSMDANRLREGLAHWQGARVRT